MKYLKYMILIVGVVSVTGILNAQPDSVYLFSYFKGNGEEGLHLAYSQTGYHWKALNNDRPVLKPGVGNDKLMRDPCIIEGGDGQYHMVWTVSWGEKGIGYAHSKDLVHWSEQQFLPVMEHEEKALNCWAPELFFDEPSGTYLIYWSSTIPGRYPDTDTTGDQSYNHRIYYTTTRDFKSFSRTGLLYDDGFNVIDAVIKKVGNTFYMVLKDETKKPVARKNLRLSKSTHFRKEFSPAGPPFSINWVEGPTVIRISQRNEWILYYDEYTRKKMGALKTSDWEQWEDISDQISFPPGLRHGTAFKAPYSILKNLESVLGGE